MNKILLAVLCVIPILLAQAIWIFQDARKRGENQWLWGIMGLINCPGSLLVYLLVTRSGSVKCKSCGRNVKKKYDNCPYCGTMLHKTCRKCGRKVEEGWDYCPYCSRSLKEE